MSGNNQAGSRPGIGKNHSHTITAARNEAAGILVAKYVPRLGWVTTPAIWAVSRKAPTAGEVGAWGTVIALAKAGVPGVGWAAAGTAVIRGMVHDHIERRLREVREGENPEIADGIRDTARAGWSGSQTNAMKIVSTIGATCWEHPNGLWVYLVDKKNCGAVNFSPRYAGKIYRPIVDSNGNAVRTATGFRWTSERGSHQ